MGYPVARLRDYSTGHGCHPPRPNYEASETVFVNGRGAHRQNDHWETHCCRDCHVNSATQTGSYTVFVNGRGLGRVNDSLTGCESVIMTGSDNVFAG